MPPNVASPGFAYPASRVSSSTLDWPVIGTDPQDDYWREAAAISNRSWHLWRNNPYAVAMTRTMTEGIIGANGLIPRSIYRGDPSQPLDQADPSNQGKLSGFRDNRLAIESSLRRAYTGTRFDATGQATKRDMSNLLLTSMMVAGDGFAIRQWKPNRPGRQYQATCWRVIDPSRVSNPNFGYNSANLFEGIVLDDDGCPIGIHVQRRNPYAVQLVDYTWDYIPMYAADGTRNVIHVRAPGRPDELRGVGWFAPIMSMVNMLGQVSEAYVVAKRVQACIGTIESSIAPDAAATTAANGASKAGTGKLYPGIRMMVPQGTQVTCLNWNFQGSDHSAFQDSCLQSICAAWGLPMEFVQHRLTKTSLAASRAALQQAYRTFHVEQEHMIESVEQPFAESVLLEDIARGRLNLGTTDLDTIFQFRFNRPSKQFPDPVKEATAAKMWADLGKSPSSSFSEQGLDHEEEVLQSHSDRAFMAAHGVPLNTATNGQAPMGAPGDDQTTPEGQPNSDASGPDAADPAQIDVEAAA